ncbi:hypothetical protein FRACYDRAFT_233320 [Fragilariopsis cylindrus CCMP1102]|uniref:Uncharacterized protein n=1 Tax=Fragilariopsis cylindrus CCMP1102 TaxID=635003 RepID=A0A1E7FYC2_9STRA|nr:hypothetical protein FRACYDRAFT_233320 [Fragilariopsis cylindrus CCMP1102]|eukprot:OEU23151.1 hypothetical protein FRACYDRAFT_233320 [Fragilariopsis cylindrus CCMP1102]
MISVATMQQQQSSSSSHPNNNNGGHQNNSEELTSAISAALKDDESSVEEFEAAPGSSYSANSSFTSIDVTQELNDLLESVGKEEGEDDGGGVLFEDIETKDENNGSGPISVMDNAASTSTTTTTTTSSGEKLSSSSRLQKKEFGDSPSFDDGVAASASTTVIDDAKKISVDVDASKRNNNGKEEKKFKKKKNNKNKDKNDKQQQQIQKHIDVVPLKQFENALALIQDLENRIHVLETDQQCVLEENETLREETLKQAYMMAQLEDKLALFPKLLEETVTQEAQVAAAQAEAKTKICFWRKDMQRQEKELQDEKLKQNRKGSYSATTQSLKQSDFLKDVVERKEQEEQQSSFNNSFNINNNHESPITFEQIDNGDKNIDTSSGMNNGVEDDRHDDKEKKVPKK